MKTLNIILLATILAASASITVLAQEPQYEEFSEDPVTQFMTDPESRSIVMNKIATDPQMRHQMMKNMMNSMPKDVEESTRKMMADPEMKARMQMHMNMMQTMLNSEESSQKEMQEMMNSPEMKSMMKMHTMYLEMMGLYSMGEKQKHSGEGHTH